MTTGTVLLGISIALIAGLISTRIIKLLHLPNVTGYLVVGILLGPYFFSLFNKNLGGILTEEMVDSFGLIVDVALGFIAFSIGGEFKLSSLKKLGKGVITITVLQASMALIFVDVALAIVCLCNNTFEAQLPLILTLGAVATATAPAATLMVIKQYKAKGPVTETLLPVVALDDAIGLILFSISFAIAQVFAKQYAGVPGATISFYSIAVVPFLEIVTSLAGGAIIGFILSFIPRFFKSRANRLIAMIAAVLLGVALCDLCDEHWGVEMSSLLTCMMIGAVFCNVRKDATTILDGIERWTPAVYMLFFVLSGAELQFSAMANIVIVGICAVYIIARSLGKYLGARWGCHFAKTDHNVKKFLGLTLLPQAGVAIGMARSASTNFTNLAIRHESEILPAMASNLETIGTTIMAVVLCATLFYELFGPVITKIALTKAGEIKSDK